MKLTALLERLQYEVVQGTKEIEITELTNDSRKVTEGSVFVCISGAVSDGHQYIEEVGKKGAAAVIVEKDVEAQSETVTESDSQGGTRTTQNSSHGESTVYDGDGSQGQAPYISKELSPQVEGVVVIASGGDNAVVKQNITEAVQALFGIDTHKIRIMKKNS